MQMVLLMARYRKLWYICNSLEDKDAYILTLYRRGVSTNSIELFIHDPHYY